MLRIFTGENCFEAAVPFSAGPNLMAGCGEEDCTPS